MRIKIWKQAAVASYATAILMLAETVNAGVIYNQTIDSGLGTRFDRPSTAAFTFTNTPQPLSDASLTVTTHCDCNGFGEHIPVYAELFGGALLGNLYTAFDTSADPITRTETLTIPASVLAGFVSDMAFTTVFSIEGGTAFAEFRALSLAYTGVEAAAVPEPSTLAVFAFGLAGLSLMGWRGRKTMTLRV